ncbi:hypothetical protein Hanom_Chr04g00308641 [Helianthus anomalus]
MIQNLYANSHNQMLIKLSFPTILLIKTIQKTNLKKNTQFYQSRPPCQFEHTPTI